MRSQKSQTQQDGKLAASRAGRLMLRAPDKRQSVLCRRLTSRHVETEKLYQEERWRRQWPVGGFRVYWKLVIIGSLVGQAWAMRENSRVTPELSLVAFA